MPTTMRSMYGFLADISLQIECQTHQEWGGREGCAWGEARRLNLVMEGQDGTSGLSLGNPLNNICTLSWGKYKCHTLTKGKNTTPCCCALRALSLNKKSCRVRMHTRNLWFPWKVEISMLKSLTHKRIKWSISDECR